MNVPKQ
jgi:hypothetical protein